MFDATAVGSGEVALEASVGVGQRVLRDLASGDQCGARVGELSCEMRLAAWLQVKGALPVTVPLLAGLTTFEGLDQQRLHVPGLVRVAFGDLLDV